MHNVCRNGNSLLYLVTVSAYYKWYGSNIFPAREATNDQQVSLIVCYTYMVQFTCSVNHVIQHNCNFPFYITNQIHYLKIRRETNFRMKILHKQGNGSLSERNALIFSMNNYILRNHQFPHYSERVSFSILAL